MKENIVCKDLDCDRAGDYLQYNAERETQDGKLCEISVKLWIVSIGDNTLSKVLSKKTKRMRTD